MSGNVFFISIIIVVIFPLPYLTSVFSTKKKKNIPFEIYKLTYHRKSNTELIEIGYCYDNSIFTKTLFICENPFSPAELNFDSI